MNEYKYHTSWFSPKSSFPEKLKLSKLKQFQNTAFFKTRERKIISKMIDETRACVALWTHAEKISSNHAVKRVKSVIIG